jgi:subtilisin family serine protease
MSLRAVLCLMTSVLALVAIPLSGSIARAGLDEKIDEQVRARMEPGQPLPVLVLCRSQLLLGPDALERFAALNAGRPRSELRAEVIAELEALAAAEQPAVIAALGAGVQVRRFWIVNAVAAMLTPEQIERVAALDEVRYVYYATALTPRNATGGGVATVLPEIERPPFSTKGKRVGWNLKKIKATKVWKSLGVTGEGTVVALLDGGTEYTHDDLRRNVWRNPGEVANNGQDDDANGYVDDLYGFDFSTGSPEVGHIPGQPHGTNTAGIIAGDGSGGIVTGVAPRARLMILKSGLAALDGNILAYEYALANGADVMSMSFSIPDLGNVRGVWRLMSDHAVAAGLVLASGAGNFQQSHMVPVQIRIPGGIPSVIAAGGVDRRLKLAFFSSTGPVEWGSVRFYGDFPLPEGLTKPNVVAFPGPGYPLVKAGGGYIDPNPSVFGNSFSGPHVAGVAALVLSANPELQAWRVGEILEETARDLDAPGKDPRTGAGPVDAFEAVKAATSASALERRGPSADAAAGAR